MRFGKKLSRQLRGRSVCRVRDFAVDFGERRSTVRSVVSARRKRDRDYGRRGENEANCEERSSREKKLASKLRSGPAC